MTGIVELFVILAIIGVIAWAITTMVPMPSQIKTVIIVVAVLICLLIVLQAFGGVGLSIPSLR